MCIRPTLSHLLYDRAWNLRGTISSINELKTIPITDTASWNCSMPPELKRKRLPISEGLPYERQTCDKSTQTCDSNNKWRPYLATFPSFPRLPLEIQVMILDLAADPDDYQPPWRTSPEPGGYCGNRYGNKLLDDDVLDYLFTHVDHSTSQSVPYEAPEAPGLKWCFFLQKPYSSDRGVCFIGPGIFKTRLELACTSRLARLVALGAWKRDLEMAISTIDEEKEWYEYRGLQGARTKLVIGSIEFLIVEVKRRIEES